MYVFATAALLGLGVMAFARCVDRYVGGYTHDHSAFVGAVLGVLAAWLADFDVFSHWGVAMREHWIGIVLTGLALGGLAQLCHGVTDMVTGFVRKTNDEADALEKGHGLKAA